MKNYQMLLNSSRNHPALVAMTVKQFIKLYTLIPRKKKPRIVATTATTGFILSECNKCDPLLRAIFP